MWAFSRDTTYLGYGLVGDNRIHDLPLLSLNSSPVLPLNLLEWQTLARLLLSADCLHIMSARNGQTEADRRDTLRRTIGKALPFQTNRLPFLRVSMSDL